MAPSDTAETQSRTTRTGIDLRVVLVSRFPKSIDEPRGGVETATIGLAKALIGIGVADLHIVTLEKSIDAEVSESHEGIQVHRLPRSKTPMFFDVFSGPSIKTLNAKLKELNPSMVHYHETWGFSAPDCEYPAVFTVHGFDSLNLPTSKPRFWRIRSKIWDIAERKGIGRQKNVISIAPYVRREIEARSDARVFDIWNPLSKYYFELERSPSEANLLFLGWLNPRKNPLAIVRAAAALRKEFPNLSVDLCGEASDSHYLQVLEAEIKKLNLTECVHLRGRQSQTQVREKIKQATILVLPSYQENAPMVVAEAMAAGVPVVASNRCGMPDMLENGTSGILIDPDKLEELVSALRKLLGDPKLREEMGTAGKSLATARFHPDSVANKTLKAYEQIIAENNLP